MTTILPVKVIGAEATFTAVYADDEVQSETYTNTPDGRVGQPHTKATLTAAYDEFKRLVAEKETAKAAPGKPSDADARAEYFDAAAAFKKLTKAETDAAFKAAFPNDAIT